MTIAWPTVDPDLPPPPRRRRWIWPAAAGGVVLIAVAVVALVLPSRSPQVSAPVAVTAPSTTTSVVTSTPPAPDAFAGNGNTVLELKRSGVLTFECPQCTGNVVVESGGVVLLKVIGAYTGKRWLGTAGRVNVKAKGTWKLSVTDPETVSGEVSGSGDAVLMLTETFKSAKVTNKGKGAFVLMGDKSTVIRRTGNYQGTVRLTGPVLVQIQSAGTWTITPQ
ncbi:hypothetical protein LWC34_35155 [Kibdelosporangium philippinense]|uniref:Adhesin domain-containing protein n=1 Tax=Kibdelosporangium philippinense TaxID=211113 RepID=A0ABS8ZJQ9_9PSEU|nr:hypothetical protein [Kibdelosporangium philippinense]MCE7008024.1 hypothetical protein [Kibdelosporangium philippinense]